MLEPTITAHGVTVTITRATSSDGAPVIYVDTDASLESPTGPLVRIRLNDDLTYAGVPCAADWPSVGPAAVA